MEVHKNLHYSFAIEIDIENVKHRNDLVMSNKLDFEVEHRMSHMFVEEQVSEKYPKNSREESVQLFDRVLRSNSKQEQLVGVLVEMDSSVPLEETFATEYMPNEIEFDR